jgi:thymidylate synthase (FAD)
MKYIDPSFEILIPNRINTIASVYDHIEKCARTCYKSEDKIKYEDCPFESYAYVDLDGNIVSGIEEDSVHSETAEGFVNRLIKSQHGAMLEHGTIYLTIYEDVKTNQVKLQTIVDFYKNNPYSKIHTIIEWGKRRREHYITTNYRVIIENKRESDLKYMTNPVKGLHDIRLTVKFITDRGVANEFVRHRIMSFGQESTRFCCYSKDKFGSEISIIRPWWMNDNFLYMAKPGPYKIDSEWHILNKETNESVPVDETEVLMTNEFINIENVYNKITTKSDDYKGRLLTAQDARHILPLGLKTELVCTGFMDAWDKFFDLRYFGTTGAPHPEAKRIAEPLYKEVQKFK